MGFEQRELVHADLKPSNLLVEADGTLRVLDLGMARVPWASWMGLEDHFDGTPAYCAPEHLAGAELTAKADVFSFGATAWSLATGRSPFPPTVDRVDHQVPLPPLPTELQVLLRRCLSPRPEDRPTAEELARAFACDRPELPVPVVAPVEKGPLVPVQEKLLALLAIAGTGLEVFELVLISGDPVLALYQHLQHLQGMGLVKRDGPRWSHNGPLPERVGWADAIAEALCRVLPPDHAVQWGAHQFLRLPVASAPAMRRVPEPALERAWRLRGQGRHSTAIEVLQAVAEPDDDVLCLLVALQLDVGRVRHAEELAQRISPGPARVRWLSWIDAMLDRPLDVALLSATRGGRHSRVLAALEVLGRSRQGLGGVEAPMAEALAPGEDWAEQAYALTLVVGVTGRLPALDPGLVTWLRQSYALRCRVRLLEAQLGLRRVNRAALRRRLERKAELLLPLWSAEDRRTFELRPVWTGPR